jgi:hypothetical protein
MHARRSLGIAFAALVLFAGGLRAQQRIELRGRGDIENDAFLHALLERDSLVIIATDTVLTRNDTIAGTVVVLGATARIDGVIAGDLVIVDGNVFLRPTARVLGRVHNVGGGLYPSELAVVERGIRSEPNAPYEVERLPDGTMLIRGVTDRSVLLLEGLYGFGLPTYDRVDAVTLRYGVGLLLPRIALAEPVLRTHVEYRSGREKFTGGAELGVTRGRTSVVTGVERATLTSDRWIRSDLFNSATFLVLSDDYRDYYQADRAYAEVRRVLERGSRTLTAFVRGQIEEPRSLLAGSPWTVRGTPRPDNVIVEGERTTSALAGLDLEWTHPLHVIRADGVVELAGRLIGGDHDFARYALDAEWAMSALADHTLELWFHFQGPLPGTERLPAQRWTLLGGSGTLYTFDIAAFRGDRLAFVHSLYSIPLPARFRMRFLGLPALDLIHSIGMAWSDGISPGFEQNLGLRLRYNVVFVRVVTNPDNFRDDATFAAGVMLPVRARPWHTPR